MAERRMFARGVTNSAKFLRMPQTSRLLYYDLGMAADDDGVVEAYTVLRTTGAAEDDLRVLASRGFVVVLNDDLVSWICDWKTNNQIRQDRYKPSLYQELLVKLADGNQMATNGLPDGNQMETQDRIGKVSQGKESIGESERSGAPALDAVQEYFSEKGFVSSADQFFDYYQARGWLIQGKPVVDWKSLARTWEGRELRLHPEKASVKKPVETRAVREDGWELYTDPVSGEKEWLPF